MSATAAWWMFDILATIMVWLFGIDQDMSQSTAAHMEALPGYLLIGCGVGVHGQLIAGIIDAVHEDLRS